MQSREKEHAEDSIGNSLPLNKFFAPSLDKGGGATGVSFVSFCLLSVYRVGFPSRPSSDSNRAARGDGTREVVFPTDYP